MKSPHLAAALLAALALASAGPADAWIRVDDTGDLAFDEELTALAGIAPSGALMVTTRPAAGRVPAVGGQRPRMGDYVDYTLTYDSGDLVAVTDATEGTTRRWLDAAGRVRRVTDARGYSTQYDYDDVNRLTRVEDAAREATTLDYDENGNLRFVTDARGGVTEFVYDDMDRLSKRRDPLYPAEPTAAHEETFTYDGNGNLLTHTDRRGLVSEFVHDGLDRRTFSGFNRTAPETYESTIDVTYSPVPADQSEDVVLTDSRWPTPLSLNFNAHEELIGETGPTGTVGYVYDAAGRRTLLQVGVSVLVGYGYDEAERVNDFETVGRGIHCSRSSVIAAFSVRFGRMTPGCGAEMC